MIDILESLPKINAYGLFEVNLEMLPKVVTLQLHLLKADDKGELTFNILFYAYI